MKQKELDERVKEIKGYWGSSDTCNECIKEFKELLEEVLKLEKVDENEIWEKFKKIDSSYLDEEWVAEEGTYIKKDTPVHCENIVAEFSNLLEDVFDSIKLENKKRKKKVKIIAYEH